MPLTGKKYTRSIVVKYERHFVTPFKNKREGRGVRFPLKFYQNAPLFALSEADFPPSLYTHYAGVHVRNVRTSRGLAVRGLLIDDLHRGGSG